MSQRDVWLLGILAAAAGLWLYSRTRAGQDAAVEGVALLDVAASRITNTLTSRGYRNNNPGNIRYIATNPWNGQIGNDGGYGIYDTPRNGTRALGHQLRKYGSNTIGALISKWAPAADSNNTAAYIADVSSQLDIDAWAPIDVVSQLADLAEAIARHENGYIDSTYDFQWVYLT